MFLFDNGILTFMEQIQMKKILSKIYYSRLNFCVEKKSQKKPGKVLLKIFQHHIDFLTAHYQLVDLSPMNS